MNQRQVNSLLNRGYYEEEEMDDTELKRYAKAKQAEALRLWEADKPNASALCAMTALSMIGCLGTGVKLRGEQGDGSFRITTQP